MNRRKAAYLISYTIVAYFIFSCTKDNKNSELTGITQDKVSFTNNLKQLSNGILYEADSAFKILKGRKKIVSIVDGVCMKCVINDLNFTDQIFQEVNSGNKNCEIVYILNVPSSDSLYFLKHFEPFINVKGIVLWDDSYRFEKSNNLLSPEKKDRTFLLDEKNQIILIGNPLYDPKLMEKYKKRLESGK